MRRTALPWLAVLLLPAGALASATHPRTLQTETGAGVAPPCTVCHQDNLGGSGTVTRAFGLAMMDRGLTGGSNQTSLRTALTKLQQDKVDSDGDGTIDFDELAQGRDPNVSATGGKSDCFPGTASCGTGGSTDGGPGPGPGTGVGPPLPEPTYGCSAGLGGGALGGLLLALGALTARRHRG